MLSLIQAPIHYIQLKVLLLVIFVVFSLIFQIRKGNKQENKEQKNINKIYLCHFTWNKKIINKFYVYNKVMIYGNMIMLSKQHIMPVTKRNEEENNS